MQLKSAEQKIEMRFRKILFPVDFSKPCLAAIPCVAEMQQSMDAELVLLHCIELPDDWPPVDAEHQWVSFDSLRACDYKRLQCFAAEHFKTKVDVIQEAGDPAAVISRCVRSHGVDLIMMPTHGYGLFRRALLGSVTTKVLHDVRCAVWTSSHSDAICNSVYRHVLCAVDDPDASGALVRSAAEFAEDFDSRLSIVHAYPDFTGTPAERYQRDLPKDIEAGIRRRLDCMQQLAGTAIPAVIARGEVHDVVAETARRCKADLIIVGRGTYGGFLYSLRSHLFDVIRSAPCPVLVLNETDAQTPPSE